MVILSIDPGKYNFAYSFLKKDGTILKLGMLSHRIDNLKNTRIINKEINGFLKEIKNLIKYNKIYVVFERFVPRGKSYHGNLVEITCLKIGLLLSVFKLYSNCYIIPILASTWKNYYNKNNLWITNDSIPEHISDAISMGYYFLLKHNKLTIPYVKRLVKSHNRTNFNWYKYKNEWYYGDRLPEHKRGRKNSFGN